MSVATVTPENLVASISATEKPINKIFCEDYAFQIPSYQRPYSWKIEQAEQLLEDIAGFALRDLKPNEIPPYFVGSLVLIKKQTSPLCKIVDGQQRLTTFTILLSCLRHCIEDGELKGELTDYIYEKGSKTKGTVDSYRLMLRDRDQEYFNKIIQKESGLESLDMDSEIPDSQKRIRENASSIIAKLEGKSQSDLERLALYIAQKCFMVIVATTEEESAFRIFTVLNDRGLQLSHADILKSEIIESIEENKRDQYTKKWEDCEEHLGIENFKELFSHIRSIYAKKKAEESILKEIRKYGNPAKDGVTFIEKELEPYSEAYSWIINCDYEAKAHAEAINHHIKWLNKIENTDWIPPLLLYFSLHKGNAEKIYNFIRSLEQLTVGMEILGCGINARIERFADVMKIIEAGGDILNKAIKALYLNDSEVTDIKKRLRSNDLYGRRFLKILLLKIDEKLSEGAANYDYPLITIEHVLPQTPSLSSTWVTVFNDQQRKDMTNCLGNLLLLTRRKNSSAQNFDFDEKVKKYFTAKNGISPFALTTQVLQTNTWTPEIVKARTIVLATAAENLLEI